MTAHPFHGTIRHDNRSAKLILDDRSGYLRFISRMKDGKRVTMTLTSFRKARSLPQNSYYHGIVLKTFGDHLGYTTEELHEAMKARFLVIDPDAPIPRWKSTAQLSTVEFNEYIEKIIQLAAENDCYIPDPNEEQLMSYMQTRNR